MVNSLLNLYKLCSENMFTRVATVVECVFTLLSVVLEFLITNIVDETIINTEEI